MTYTIAEPCIDVKDKGCVDECPVDCIYEGPRMLYIHPDECVDCGACEPVCPVTAIFYEDDVPAEWKQFNAINAEWFNDDISGRAGGQGPPDRRGLGLPLADSPGAARCRRVDGREEHAERGAPTVPLFHPRPPVMHLGEPAHEGEPHTDPR
jgi:ferredoxin